MKDSEESYSAVPKDEISTKDAPELQVEMSTKLRSHSSRSSEATVDSHLDLIDSISNLEVVEEEETHDHEHHVSKFQQFQIWIHRLKRTFGCRFLLLVGIVYWVQGFKSFAELSINYLYKDVFNLDPSESQILFTAMMFPWGVKPLYGILSDSLPLCGYRRRSYLFTCALMATIAYLALSISSITSNAYIATFFLFFTNLSTAFNDVVIDAKVVEMSRLDPLNGANDLQTVSWSMLSFGGVLGSLLGGPAMESFGERWVFFLFSAAPLTILILSITMSEPRVKRSTSNVASPRLQCCVDAKKQGSLLCQAIRVPVIWKSALWIFLSNAVAPNFGQVKFYFNNDVLKFTPAFLGTVNACGYVFLMVGTMIYNTFYKHLPFRKIFFWAQISLVLVSMLELLQVTRYNLKLGISDKLFMLGDEILADIVSRMKTMPMLVLSAKLCPPGVEGTLFALLMSISNCSWSVSSFFGALLGHLLGLSKNHYDNLWIAVIIRSFFKLIPIFFLFLIPDRDPVDEVRIFQRKLSEDEHKESNLQGHDEVFTNTKRENSDNEESEETALMRETLELGSRHVI